MPIRTALKLPGLSAAASQMIVHALIIFLTVFGGQMVTSLTGAISMSAIEATLISAGAAGLTAVIHFLLGLVPTPVPVAMPSAHGLRSYTLTAAAGVSVKVTSSLYQVLISTLTVFLTVFGAQVVAGATHVTSLPTLKDLIIAAITAAVAAAVQYVVKLVPVPTAVAA